MLCLRTSYCQDVERRMLTPAAMLAIRSPCGAPRSGDVVARRGWAGVRRFRDIPGCPGALRRWVREAAGRQMDSPDQVDLNAVTSVKGLAGVLQQLRLLRIDRMSYAKMAYRIQNEISRSEMGRIFAGDDFPNRAQLHLILDILRIPRSGREEWDAKWDRLAQDYHGSEVSSRKALDLPTRTVGEGTPVVTGERQEKAHPDYFDDEPERKRANAIIEDARAEASQIIRSARAAGEIEYENLIQDARAKTSNLISNAIADFAQIVHDIQAKIAGIASDAEDVLKTAIGALNDSALNSHRAGKELERLMDEARVSMDEARASIGEIRNSMGEIRSELAQFRAETESTKEGYEADYGSHQAPVAGENNRKRWRVLSDRLFSDDRRMPPPILGENPDYGADNTDHAPPWLKDS